MLSIFLEEAFRVVRRRRALHYPQSRLCRDIPDRLYEFEHLVSVRSWEHLTIECGWPTTEYVRSRSC